MTREEYDAHYANGLATVDESFARFVATEGPHDAWAALKRRMDWMTDRAKGPNVLDVGCGSGTLAILAAHRPGIEAVVGIDLLRANVSIAAQNWQETGTLGAATVRFDVGDAERPTFPTATFDTVFLGEILEHVWDVDAALMEAHRVLDDNGVMVISVPTDQRVTGDHLRTFTLASIIELLTRRGLVIREFKRINHWLCFVCTGESSDAD